jgi:hypothetical protein
MPKFFADHASQRGLQLLAASANEIPQRQINQALLVGPACFIYFIAESIQQVSVQPDGHAGLRGGTFTTAPRLPLLKSYSRFICSPW